jgi:hypothetical protein
MKGEKTWLLPTCATLRMRSLEQPEDVAKYLGHAYAWLGWDEAGAFPDDRAYKMMFGCLRSAEPVDCKRIRATANPGGPGHGWLKRRFIDPAPHGYEIIADAETGMDRIYIPSRVSDNIVLMKRDPRYVERLKGVGSPELVRAWLDGDWNAVVGSYFPEFGAQHIIRPFRIPAEFTRFRSFDWGSARPFACLWFAVVDGTTGHPKGALICYRELYGASAPNIGLRLSAEQVADMIRDREISDDRITYSIADPSIFTSDGGPSIAERMAQRAVRFRPADNRRVGKLGAAAGWDLVRQHLIGDEGQPMIYFFDTCKHTIRTIPIQQHDPRRPEDLDTSGDDHCVDAVRYAVASRPWVAAARDPEPVVSMNFLWERREREREGW